jgi:uncharacterized repeat protein (TIGR03803 family)
MTHLFPCVPAKPIFRGLCSSVPSSVLLASVLSLAQSSQAQTEATLYSFTMKGSNNGTLPSAGPVRDSAGNLYGTTANGGAFNHGTLFKLSGTTLTTLYSFSGKADGGLPNSSLLRDAAGNLYGTTEIGGDLNCNLDATRKETTLYGFTGGNGGTYGANPNGVIRDSAGNLYGSTASGGPGNFGTVFRVDSTGKETVLFQPASPPATPSGRLPATVGKASARAMVCLNETHINTAQHPTNIQNP